MVSNYIGDLQEEQKWGRDLEEDFFFFKESSWIGP